MDSVWSKSNVDRHVVFDCSDARWSNSQQNFTAFDIITSYFNCTAYSNYSLQPFALYLTQSGSMSKYFSPGDGEEFHHLATLIDELHMQSEVEPCDVILT